MSVNNQIEDNKSRCLSTTGIGTKLMFLILGGGIGAAIALLFAPKPGRELRQDIADAAVKSYDETLEAATRVKEQTLEYYEAAMEKGGDVLDVVTEEASALKDEVKNDAAKIGGIVRGAARRVAHSVKPTQIL